MTIGKVGFIAGCLAFAAALSYDAVQILQVVRILKFPFDEILIYGTSLCIVVPLLVEMLAFHHVTPASKRFWSHAALLFTIIYAVFVTANYVVQLATVVPAKMEGTIDAIRVIDQTPHSMFWNYDAIGYVAMGLACLFALPAVRTSGSEVWVRRALIAHVLVTPLITFVYFYPNFSTSLLFVGFPWAITAPLFMIAMAIMLRNRVGFELSPGVS